MQLRFNHISYLPNSLLWRWASRCQLILWEVRDFGSEAVQKLRGKLLGKDGGKLGGVFEVLIGSNAGG